MTYDSDSRRVGIVQFGFRFARRMRFNRRVYRNLMVHSVFIDTFHPQADSQNNNWKIL